jgi:hypothetical protein
MKENENEKKEEKAEEKTEEKNNILLSNIISGLSSSSISFDNKESKDESNDSDLLLRKEESSKVILDLQQKIILLEKNINDLKSKNEDLTKSNIEKNSLMTRISLVGLRRGFAFHNTLNKVQNDSVKLAEIIKEKNDLQEMNQKMLDLLTEKEIENEDLLQKLENSKLESELENDKNLEKIQILEEKIMNLENSKRNEGNSYDIDNVISEYNNYKERLKRQINEYMKNEGDLKEQLDLKDRTIQKLNQEIQGLQLDNLQLIDISKNKEKLSEKENLEIEQLKSENLKIKEEMGFLEEKLNLAKENAKKESKEHENEIMEYQQKIESEQKYLKIYKESKSKEINSMKNEISKHNREITLYNNKIDSIEKILNDQKGKLTSIQKKLDKKTKELQDMNEYTKKLLSNKDNLLSQYEEKIEAISKEKNDLVTLNKELLEKVKSKTEINLAEIINEDENSNKEDLQYYAQENKLFREEIANLKEQLNSQAKDLVELNTLDKEVLRLKTENENLMKDFKVIKNKLEEQKKKEEQAELMEKKKQLTKAIRSLKKKSEKLDVTNYEKQLDALKKLKEEEKKDYEEQIKKLKIELTLVKLRYLKLQNKNDSLLSNYKNIIKVLSSQYIKKYSIFIILAILSFIVLVFAIKKL